MEINVSGSSSKHNVLVDSFSVSKMSSRLLPKAVQVVLFSATFPNHVVEYASRFAPNANQITLRHEELTVEGIKQLYLDCPTETDKYDALVRLYGMMTIGSSIIFVRVILSS